MIRMCHPVPSILDYQIIILVAKSIPMLTPRLTGCPPGKQNDTSVLCHPEKMMGDGIHPSASSFVNDETGALALAGFSAPHAWKHGTMDTRKQLPIFYRPQPPMSEGRKS